MRFWNIIFTILLLYLYRITFFFNFMFVFVIKFYIFRILTGMLLPIFYILAMLGQFHRAAIIQGVLLYTMNPSKTARKSKGGLDYRTRIIPLLSSMKPASYLLLFFCLVLYKLAHFTTKYQLAPKI
jgi:hypothetical protein